MIELSDIKIQNTELKQNMNNVYFECHNVNAIFIDIAKAFDSISHGILIFKLRKLL